MEGTLAVVWRVDYRFKLDVVDSFLLSICLSLGRYFSEKQKEYPVLCPV